MGESTDRYRVAFLFNAQLHQLMHGITTAIELSRDPAMDVHVFGASAAHLDYARALIERSGGAAITLSPAGSELLDAVSRLSFGVLSPKVARLTAAVQHLSRFDAIAVPERTSILLKRLGVRGPRYIHLDHGAGDRAIGFDPRIRLFDFVLVAGRKTQARLARDGLIRPGSHAVIGYPKYDAADAMREPGWSPFSDDRPIVLYNPHFSGLGSWPSMGERVLEAFAAQDRYNLVFAPHMRLFDDPAMRARGDALIARFGSLPHIHLDLGSARSADMSYTMLADIYLGDVSSQIYEFLRTPKPCLFLNANRVAWSGDEDYLHWRFGPVIDDITDLPGAVDAAVAEHGAWRAEQEHGFAETFDLTEETSSSRAARAIGVFLRYGAVDPSASGGAAAKPPPAVTRPRRLRGWWRPSALRQAAAMGVVLSAGWLAHATLMPKPMGAADQTIIEEALQSDDATMIRVSMRSQVETPVLDTKEIAAATAIHLPSFPPDWRIADVQIYPSDAGPGVQIVLRTPEGQNLTFLALRGGWTGDNTLRMAERGRQTVAYWVNHNLSLALVARLPAERLRPLAERLTAPPTRPSA